MDIQNHDVSIQINAKDLSGKRLRVSDCDVFIIHVFTDDPKFYLTFSKRDMLMTETVDELVVPKHQMEQLRSGVVQYQYDYLPHAHDCVHEHCYSAPEFDFEAQNVYHPERPCPGHFHEDLIHSKPVVTSIYWRNIHCQHPHQHPVNNVTFFDIERLHRLIEKERIDREKDFETLQGVFTEGYDAKLTEEVERATAEEARIAEEFDTKLNEEVERATTEETRIAEEFAELKKQMSEFTDSVDDSNEKVETEVKDLSADLKAEINRATAKEIELEQLITGETSRAKGVEEVIETKIVMERERAMTNESNIADRIDSVTEKFESFKTIQADALSTEVARAKATESALNDKIQGVIGDLKSEVSRAAQKDIEHTNLVETEANRAKAVENKIATDLETEITRAKDAEKHILDEVHAVEQTVSNLATATNVYTKSEVDTKINDVKNDIDTVNNWINNHTDNTDELKVKVANLAEAVDKAKSDIIAEVAKCDAQNGKLATDIQTLDGKVDAEIERAKAAGKLIAADIEDYKANSLTKHTELSEGIADANANLALEVARATAAEKVNSDAIAIINGTADEAGSIKKALSDAKDYTDAEIIKAKLANSVELADTLNNYATKDEVDGRIQGIIGTAPEAFDTLGEIADALNSDSDAITAINGVLSGKANSADVYSKAEVDATVSSINNTIATEVTNRVNADATLDAKIVDLTTKVANVETTVADNDAKVVAAIAAEEAARKSVDSSLSDKIDGKVDELNTKISDVNATLIADIASSSAKDTELEAKIDANTLAINSEVARAKEVETELNSKINALDVAGANSQIAALGDALNSEISRAQTAEDAINAKLDVINGDASVVGSIAHALHDAEHHIDDAIADLKSELNAKIDNALVPDKLSEFVNDCGFVTGVEVTASVATKADKADVYTKAEVDAALADVDVTDQLVDYATKADVSALDASVVAIEQTITEISEIFGDVFDSSVEGGQTLTEIIANKADKSEIQALDASLGDALDSAKSEMTQYVATEKLVILESANTQANNLIDAALEEVYTKAEVDAMFSNFIWSGTQAEYDAMASHDANKIYVIVE